MEAKNRRFDKRWFLVGATAAYFVLIVLLQAMKLSAHPVLLTAVGGLATSTVFACVLRRFLRNEEMAFRYIERIRKRHEEELESRAKKRDRIASEIVRELIPALDGLDRAMAHGFANPELGRSFIEGLDSVRQQFFDSLLDDFRIDAWDPTGQLFDPACHHAIATIQRADLPPGSIVQMFERGYRIKDALIRAAKVQVVVKPQDTATSAEAADVEASPAASPPEVG